MKKIEKVKQGIFSQDVQVEAKFMVIHGILLVMMAELNDALKNHKEDTDEEASELLHALSITEATGRIVAKRFQKINNIRSKVRHYGKGFHKEMTDKTMKELMRIIPDIVSIFGGEIDIDLERISKEGGNEEG
jgi:hypothetical protein